MWWVWLQPGAPHTASRGRACDRLCPHQTKLWSLGPGLDWASASLGQSQICSVSHYSGDWTLDSWQQPSWHQAAQRDICHKIPVFRMWHHVTCDGVECHSTFVNWRKISTMTKSLIIMDQRRITFSQKTLFWDSHTNCWSKVHFIPLLQSLLRPYNDILEETLPPADIDTGRTLIFFSTSFSY